MKTKHFFMSAACWLAVVLLFPAKGWGQDFTLTIIPDFSFDAYPSNQRVFNLNGQSVNASTFHTKPLRNYETGLSFVFPLRTSLHIGGGYDFWKTRDFTTDLSICPSITFRNRSFDFINVGNTEISSHRVRMISAGLSLKLYGSLGVSAGYDIPIGYREYIGDNLVSSDRKATNGGFRIGLGTTLISYNIEFYKLFDAEYSVNGIQPFNGFNHQFHSVQIGIKL